MDTMSSRWTFACESPGNQPSAGTVEADHDGEAHQEPEGWNRAVSGLPTSFSHINFRMRKWPHPSTLTPLIPSGLPGYGLLLGHHPVLLLPWLDAHPLSHLNLPVKSVPPVHQPHLIRDPDQHVMT